MTRPTCPHPAQPPAPPQPDRRWPSPLSMGVWPRLGLAAGACLLLWLVVAWALDPLP